VRSLRLLILVFLGLFSLAEGVKAQKGQKVRDPLEFWFDPQRAQPAAVAELVAAQNPFTILALRIRGHDLVVWGEPEFAAEEAPPLDPQWLDSARERDGKPMPNIIGKAPDEISKGVKDYYRLYNQALVNAFRTPAEAFAKSAQGNEDITFAHLYNETWKYRGKVIPVKGYLRRLRKYDAPIAARAQGVKSVYEGWIALPTYKTHPLCVLFPVLPDRLKPAENMNTWVEFNGYVINLYQYKSGKGDLNTVLLIGPTVKLTQAPPAPPAGPLISPALLYGFVGFVFVVALFVICLNLWFRRGDQRVRSHLAQLQAQRTVEMLEHPGGLVDEAHNPPEENGPVMDRNPN
jgi:hypothetical protein